MEPTFCYPADFLGDRPRGILDMLHSLEGPHSEGGCTALSNVEMVRHVLAPCVAHIFDVKRRAGLACWLIGDTGILTPARLALQVIIRITPA